MNTKATVNTCIPLCTAILVTLCLFSCRKELPDIIKPLNESNFEGTVDFPSKSPLNNQYLNIISLTEEIDLPSGDTFTIAAPVDHYSFFYAEDGNGNTVGMSYQNPSKGIIINDSATALSLIFIFPIDWGTMNLTPEKLTVEILQADEFPLLLSYVKNIMINDPAGLMNYEDHPSILNTAARICQGIIHNHNGFPQDVSGSGQGSKSGSGISGSTIVPWIEDIPGDPRIRIYNPKGTPYGISCFNNNKSAKDAASYGLLKVPFYVDSWGLNWWVIYHDGKIDYNLGDGDWTIMLSRIDPWFFTALGQINFLSDIFTPITAINSGDYLTVLQSNARAKAYLGTSLNVVARVFGIISTVDPSGATAFISVAAEMGPSAADLVTDLVIGGQDIAGRSKEQIFRWLLKTVEINQDVFIKWAKKNGVKIAGKAFAKGISNLTLMLKVVNAGEDLVRLISLLYDSFLAEQDMVFVIKQSKGNADITVSKPPSEPLLSGMSYCNINEDYTYKVTSTDPENDKIKYHIYYSDGTDEQSPFVNSGTQYAFKHRWQTGSFTIFASAIDIKGASSQITNPFNVTAAPDGDFIETFEGFEFGNMPTNETWNVDFQAPSKVVISSLAQEGMKSVKFIDYDPGIGEDGSAYAQINTCFSSNLSKFETSIRVDNIEDAFGIRAWETSDDWNSIGYYIIIDRGWLKWVREARDIDDEADFIPIRPISPGTWYNLRLIVNWSTATYDIYLNGTLVKRAADFVAKSRYTQISSANNLQIVAFTNATCRSAYMDNIHATGALSEPLTLKIMESIRHETLKRSASAFEQIK